MTERFPGMSLLEKCVCGTPHHHFAQNCSKYYTREVDPVVKKSLGLSEKCGPQNVWVQIKVWLQTKVNIVKIILA